MLNAIGSGKDLTELDYYDLVSDILENDLVQELKNYRHHISTNRFQHCLNVSYYNYLVCRKLHLDVASAARAGMLHDLYYYDTKTYRKGSHELSHAKNHPDVAVNNAGELFILNSIEEDIITNHMWPLTKGRPRSKEGYVIVIVDKYCAALELIAPKMRMAMSKVLRRKSTV